MTLSNVPGDALVGSSVIGDAIGEIGPFDLDQDWLKGETYIITNHEPTDDIGWIKFSTQWFRFIGGDFIFPKVSAIYDLYELSQQE